MILNLNVRHNLIFNSFFIVWLMAFLNFIFILNIVVHAYFWMICWILRICVYTLLLNDSIFVMIFHFISLIKQNGYRVYIYVCILCFTNGNLKNVNKTADIIYTKINRLYDGSIRVAWLLDTSNHYHFSKFIHT